MYDPISEFQEIILLNGLRVYCAQILGREIESIKFIVHSGSLRDPLTALGTAHFLEHMISEKIDMEMLYQMFDEDGGDFNLGVTNRMETKFSFTSTINAFETFFEIFAQMLMEKRSFASSIEKERGIITREFLRKFPFKELFELEVNKAKAMYDNSHILSHVPTNLGSLESIEKITNDDLCKFHQTYYVPSNISIVAVGGLSVDEVLSIINKSPFAETKNSGNTFEPIPKVTTLYEPTPCEGILKISDFSSIKMNSITFLATTVLPITTDLFVIQFFRRMLHRKLRNEIREKHSWAYSVSCPIVKTDYAYEFEIKCDELSLDARQEIIPIITRCIQEIKGDILGFKRIRKSFLSEYKFIDLNVVDTRDEVVGRMYDYGCLLPTEKIVEHINSVTFTQVQELCDIMAQEKYRHVKLVLP